MTCGSHGCGYEEERGCAQQLADPDAGPLAGFGWPHEYAGRAWDRCPGWYARHAPDLLLHLARRVDRLAGLSEIGVPPEDLTDAGEILVSTARRYRDRLEAEERARVRAEEERKAKARGGRP